MRKPTKHTSISRAGYRARLVAAWVGLTVSIVGVILLWQDGVDVRHIDIVEVSREASSHNQFSGNMAAISIAILLLLLTLRLTLKDDTKKDDKRHPLEEVLVGLLCMAFFAFIVAAVLYSVVGGVALPLEGGCQNQTTITSIQRSLNCNRERVAQLINFTFAITSMPYYLGIILSLLALEPLLWLTKYGWPKHIVTWIARAGIGVGYLFVSHTLFVSGLSWWFLLVVATFTLGLVWIFDLRVYHGVTASRSFLKGALAIAALVPALSAFTFALADIQPDLFLAGAGQLTTVLWLMTTTAVVSVFEALNYIYAPEGAARRRLLLPLRF